MPICYGKLLVEMSELKRIKAKHLVSLNTSCRKLRNSYPKIARDISELLEILKDWEEERKSKFYNEDGLLDIQRK